MAAGEGGAAAHFRTALPVPSFCGGEWLPARRASLPVRPSSSVTAGLPAAAQHFRLFSPPLSQRDFLSLRPHFRSFPSTESRRHFRSLLHTSGPPLVPCHRGIRISGPHFRSSPPSVTAGFRSPVHTSGPSLPTGSVRGAPLWTPNPLRALQTGTSGAAIALLGTPRYPYRNQRSAPQPHFRFPL